MVTGNTMTARDGGNPSPGRQTPLWRESAWMRAASESHLYSKDESLEVSITWIFLRRKEAMQLVTQQRSPCIMRTAILIAVGWFVFFPTTASAAEIPSKTVPARTYSLGIVPQHKA
ncbi:MAG: hypothetical protein AAB068_00035, partial [Pseudomonadota bacterium]